jgi:hypothetical protein
MQNIKDTLTTIAGIIGAIGAAIVAVSSQITLPTWITSTGGISVAISVAVVGYLTGKNPNGTTKSDTQVTNQNAQSKSTSTVIPAILLLLGLFLAPNLFAQRKHVLGYYPIQSKTKTYKATYGDVSLQSKDSTIFFAVAASFDAFTKINSTGEYQIGILPGIGYAVNYQPKGWKSPALSLGLFIDASLDGASSPQFYNIKLLPALGFLNWVKIGYGLMYQIGVNGNQNKSSGVFIFGLQKTL